MIIAGIDEAGLGPKLGPLVVSATVFRVTEPLAGTASLWDIYSQATTKTRDRKDSRLLVTDSKIAYTGKNIHPLKNTVLNFTAALHRSAEITSINDLLQLLCDNNEIPEIMLSPWFKDLKHKISDSDNIKLDNDHIQSLTAASGAEVLQLRSTVQTAAMLNNLFSQNLNKSEVLLQQSGKHIRQIIETFTGEPLRITVDKQGGKTYYAAYLSDLLAGKWIEPVRETAESSLYKIGTEQYIEFIPKADQREFTVALASMFSKFLRELLMAEFNTFFITRKPALKPTAGYPEDARRFIDELTELLDHAKIATHHIWRER